MGDLKNQIFLQHIDGALARVREEMIRKYTPKKENRFLFKDITYEIGSCHINANGKFEFEISSKIPQNILPNQAGINRYFREVVRVMNKSAKRPLTSKMENIIHNAELEYKERDYVKLAFEYEEDELYSTQEVEKRLRHHVAKRIPVPDITGVATPFGKLVIVMMTETMEEFIRQNISDLIKANELVKANYKAPAPKKAAKKHPAKKPHRPAKRSAAVKKPPRKKAASRPAMKKKKGAGWKPARKR